MAPWCIVLQVEHSSLMLSQTSANFGAAAALKTPEGAEQEGKHLSHSTLQRADQEWQDLAVYPESGHFQGTGESAAESVTVNNESSKQVCLCKARRL